MSFYSPQLSQSFLFALMPPQNLPSLRPYLPLILFFYNHSLCAYSTSSKQLSIILDVRKKQLGRNIHHSLTALTTQIDQLLSFSEQRRDLHVPSQANC